MPLLENGPISVDGPKKDQKVGQIRLKNGPISNGGSKMDQKRGKHERENGPISVDGSEKDQNSGKVERIIGPISANPSGSDQRDKKRRGRRLPASFPNHLYAYSGLATPSEAAACFGLAILLLRLESPRSCGCSRCRSCSSSLPCSLRLSR